MSDILKDISPLPWAYRPDEYDDWGTVKSFGGLICQARGPAYDLKTLDDHRDAGTDPWEANARYIVHAANNYPALERALNSIVAIMGNVDHSRGGGANAARLYGGLLMDCKAIALSALSKAGEQ